MCLKGSAVVRKGSPIHSNFPVRAAVYLNDSRTIFGWSVERNLIFVHSRLVKNLPPVSLGGCSEPSGILSQHGMCSFSVFR